MRIKIKVTKDILRRSSGCAPLTDEDTSIRTNCAFALAVRDLFPAAEVWQFVTYPLGKMSVKERIINPMAMSAFIYEFDKKSPEQRVMMSECEVTLDVPQSVIDQIGISEVYRVLSESKTLELVSIR